MASYDECVKVRTMKNEWQRDIIEYAQEKMNNDSSMTHKGLVSHLCNEVISLRAEIERLEKLLNPTSTFKPKWVAVKIKINEDGRLEAEWDE